MSQFDWAITKKKKLKLWRLPQIEDFMETWSASTGEKGRTLGKTYEIRASCYWEHPWGTDWEPNGNPLET
jgi:hypothetical protein